MSEWMDGVDTPQTVMTTRAPAVLKRQLSGFFVIQSFFTQINDIKRYHTAVTTFSWTLLKIMMIMTIFDDDAKKAI